MASNLLKAFIHSAYLQSGKSWPAAVTLLEAILVNNFNILKSGQGSILSTTINGKSLSFSVPRGMDATTILSTAQTAWEYISNSLAADNTGTALNNFLLNRQTSTTVGDFSGLDSCRHLGGWPNWGGG